MLNIELEQELNQRFTDYLKVAVAVIKINQQILISKRKKDVHQGGKWEFPGGKIEQNESVFQALDRELFEELGIHPVSAEPLITIPYVYDEKNKVVLFVCWVSEITGEAFGKEEQEINWCNAQELSQYEFPEANKAILNAIELPSVYAIVDKQFNPARQDEQHFIKLIQIRNNHHRLNLDSVKDLFGFAKKHAIQVQINSSLHKQLSLTHTEKYRELLLKYQSSTFLIGIHLSSNDLHQEKLSLDKSYCMGKISASCHCLNDIKKVNELSLDFIVLSPVNKTASHVDASTLGWNNFGQLCSQSQVPVYALGGMNYDQINKAKSYGAQGIAGISFVE